MYPLHFQNPIYPPLPPAHLLNLIYTSLFPGNCRRWPWLIEALYIPCAKTHVPSPLLRLHQSICPGPRHMYPFRKKASFLRWGFVSTSSKSQAEGPPFASCPRLLPSILEGVPQTATSERAIPLWQLSLPTCSELCYWQISFFSGNVLIIPLLPDTLISFLHIREFTQFS